MERIAFISGESFIYWNSVILTMAAVAAIAVYAAVYIRKGGSLFALAVSVLFSVMLGIPLSRFVHWYCRMDAYDSFLSAMTDYSRGGYGLMGVFFGCLLTACILRKFRISDNLPDMLDAMAVGGGLGIAVGRLAALFNTADRGAIVPDHLGFPFAGSVTNAVSGMQENRLATFMIQSILTGILVAALMAYMVWASVKKKKVRSGDIFLLFLLSYGACQIVCDSTRYDSMFLRSNGFVSLVQILGVIALVVPIAIFSVRAVKSLGLKKWLYPVWTGILAMMGLGGYMEYYVQRNGHKAVLAYSVMSAALLAIVGLTLFIRWMEGRALAAHSEIASVDQAAATFSSEKD